MRMLRTVRLAGAALAAAVLLPTTPALGATHLVAPGETLGGFALPTGLPAGTVAAANGLSAEARVVAGTTLTIPARGVAAPLAASSAPAAARAPAAPAAPAAGGGLRVRWGDSLSAIAARNGVSMARLAAVNGLDPSRPLPAGTTLHPPAARAARVPPPPRGPAGGRRSGRPPPPPHRPPRPRWAPTRSAPATRSARSPPAAACR